MKNKLTKTDFKNYLNCPREFWLSVHHPETNDAPLPDQVFRGKQGYEVEKLAKKYLGATIDHELVNWKTAETANLSARFDVLIENGGDGGSHIYEIKSSKFHAADDARGANTRKDNLLDVAFQVFTARESGMKISKAFLITLNGEYVLGDTLNLRELFVIEDVTEAVDDLQSAINSHINDAFELLEGNPEGFDNLCSAKLACKYFQFTKPELPEWTIFDISRLHKDKKAALLESGVLDLFDVPDDFPLSKLQREFIDFVKTGELSIDKKEISARLDSLEYPLHFLDYETVNPAIPQFAGMKPLEQITFQYSLHIQKSPDSELIHREFLSDGTGVPPFEVAKKLASDLEEDGSVLVWYKSFEMGRNIELGRMFPEYLEFFTSVNERIFDLYEIFSQKLYRDPALKSNSLKAVLPKLIPALTYKNLDIGNGGEALSRWYDDVYLGTDEAMKLHTMDSLRKYCELDTFAMVEILDYLQRLVR